MPRGQTSSQYGLRERKRRAFEMFTRGYSNAQVATQLSVHPGTVANYRTEYEAELQSQLVANPALLRNVLANTIRALSELDEVRRAAWQEYDSAQFDLEATCPNCEHEFTVGTASNATTRNALLGTITKAQEQRGKLLGLFGVKAEFLLHVQHVRQVQETIIAFMRENLCTEDKLKLEALLTGELAVAVEHTTDVPHLPVLDVA